MSATTAARRYLLFVPAYVLPPLVALAGVSVFTRILDPAAYGIYAVVLSLAQASASLLFSWLPLGVKRFAAEAQQTGTMGSLTRSVYGILAACALTTAAAFGIGLVATPELATLRTVAGWGLGLVLARGLSTVAKAFQISDLTSPLFPLMEVSESAIGFAASLTLVLAFGWSGGGLIAGLACGALAAAALDLPSLVRRWRAGRDDPRMTAKLLRFSLPFTAGYALDYVLAYSDRLLVQHYLGESAVGVYAVSYTLADRGISAVFQAIALVSYPMLMDAMAAGGAAAARRQAAANLELILAIALPAWVGMVIGAPQIAAALTGPAFAPEATRIIPWIATAVLLAGLRLHYVEHAMHLAGRTEMIFLTAGIPAVLNVALNVVLLPRIGLDGAVLSTLAAYALALAICAVAAWRLFPLPVPAGAIVRSALAACVMGGVLLAFPSAPSALGLLALIGKGVGAYGVLALALDLAGVRGHVRRALGRPSTV